MANQDIAVATTILNQLGGRRFILMTGSKDFLAGTNRLSFRVGSNAKRVTHFRVTLDPSDTYTVEAIRMRGMGEMTILHKADDIYCDQLQDIFTQWTGMYTTL